MKVEYFKAAMVFVLASVLITLVLIPYQISSSKISELGLEMVGINTVDYTRYYRLFDKPRLQQDELRDLEKLLSEVREKGDIVKISHNGVQTYPNSGYSFEAALDYMYESNDIHVNVLYGRHDNIIVGVEVTH